jgi:hypothetical protein
MTNFLYKVVQVYTDTVRAGLVSKDNMINLSPSTVAVIGVRHGKACLVSKSRTSSHQARWDAHLGCSATLSTSEQLPNVDQSLRFFVTFVCHHITSHRCSATLSQRRHRERGAG